MHICKQIIEVLTNLNPKLFTIRPGCNIPIQMCAYLKHAARDWQFQHLSGANALDMKQFESVRIPKSQDVRIKSVCILSTYRIEDSKALVALAFYRK